MKVVNQSRIVCGLAVLLGIACLAAQAKERAPSRVPHPGRQFCGRYARQPEWPVAVAPQRQAILHPGRRRRRAQLLAQCGGNLFRTWGVGRDTQRELDEAQQLGLSVTLGHWLGHKEHGFHWDDPAAVRKQFETVQRNVEQYKDHPALLMWALGNEMEQGDDTPRALAGDPGPGQDGPRR